MIGAYLHGPKYVRSQHEPRIRSVFGSAGASPSQIRQLINRLRTRTVYKRLLVRAEHRKTWGKERCPANPGDGTIHGTETILFRHTIRFSEGWAREWFVAGLTCGENLAERCAIQFCAGRADKRTMYLKDPVVKEQQAGPFNLVVRAASTSCAGKMVDDNVLKQLGDLAATLSFRPEIQVRGNRLAVYLADRNATVDDVEALRNLADFAGSVANV